MGVQASTALGHERAASDTESAVSHEEVVQLQETVHEERIEVVRPTVATPVAVPVAARPPVAPHKHAPVVADRVVEIKGAIKHAFPLQSVRVVEAAESQQFTSDFSIGGGPCARDADRVVGWEVQLHDSFQTCYVFSYDKWADKVCDFQRHYKVHVRGSGLVAIDHWDIGHDTEDVKRCYVVAETLLLKQTAERSPRLLPKPTGLSIEVAFEEPQRVPESDQVRYQPEQVIHSRDLNPVVSRGEDKKKQVQQTAMKPVAVGRPNLRGKRTLREMNVSEGANAAITTPSSYTYTPLSELIPGHANLYGVVVNMSLPKRSEGSDFYMSLHLVDESCPKREDALQVMVFLPTIEQMPRVLASFHLLIPQSSRQNGLTRVLHQHVGDIVRLHKINIKKYQDKLQGVCNSRTTRYLVLRRGKSAQAIEQQTCSASWTFVNYDEERFHQLAEWSERALHVDTSLPPGCPQAPRLLGDMQLAESFADVVARVLFVQEPYGDFSSARMIVWDGSGDASLCQDLYVKLRREREARATAVPFIPPEGLLMEIVVDSCWTVMETLGLLPLLTAHWCRFRNLAVASEEGEGHVQKHWFELHFREVSSVMFVPDSTPDVAIRLNQFKRGRQARTVKTAPAQSHQVQMHADLTQPESPPSQDPVQRVSTQVPAFIIDKVPVTSLKLALECRHVPRKYHCLARVIKLWPAAIEQLAKPKSSSYGTFLYSFVMRLVDGTGQIDVIVHGDDAEKFLHGIPPCDLTKSTSSQALLQKRVTALLVLQDPSHFCLKSYKPKHSPMNEGNTKEGVRFRLFDTILQVDS